MKFVVLMLGVMLSAPVHAAEASWADYICAEVSDSAERAECTERAEKVTGDSQKSNSRTTVPWYSMFWPFGWWVIYYAVGLLIGRYIHRDAKRRDWIFLGIRPVWWSALALFDPAIGLLVYWATHYSKLAQSYHEATLSPATETSAP